MGVRLRVMVRYTGPTYVPEGEEKSPQQLQQVSEQRDTETMQNKEMRDTQSASALTGDMDSTTRRFKTVTIIYRMSAAFTVMEMFWEIIMHRELLPCVLYNCFLCT
jgi:hypothetical protein